MKSRLLCPLLTSALRSARLTTRSAPISRQQRRSPGVSSTAFAARLPDIPPWPLMAMDFVVGSPLVRPQQPLIRFLFVKPQLRSALPPDPASRRRPCASLPFTTIRLVEDFHLLTVEHAQHTTARPKGGKRQPPSTGGEPGSIHLSILGRWWKNGCGLIQSSPPR